MCPCVSVWRAGRREIKRLDRSWTKVVWKVLNYLTLAVKKITTLLPVGSMFLTIPKPGCSFHGFKCYHNNSSLYVMLSMRPPLQLRRPEVYTTSFHWWIFVLEYLCSNLATTEPKGGRGVTWSRIDTSNSSSQAPLWRPYSGQTYAAFKWNL